MQRGTKFASVRWMNQPAYAMEDDGARPISGGLLAFGRLLTVVLLLAVSPLTLFMFGWQYFDTGGSPLEKFHPATLLAVALLALLATNQARNPISGLIALMQRNQGLIPYFVAIGFMIAYTAVILKQPVTIFIETFAGAALMFLLFQDLDEKAGRTLARIIHLVMFANAMLAFYEVFNGFHLTPLVVNGEVLAEEPRATALLGHPLGNAILAGAYVVMLALGGGRDLPVALRPIVFVVALASLVPFGGRAATGAALLSLVFLVVKRLWDITRGASFEPRSVIAGLVIGPLAAITLVAADEMGAFDTLTNRLFDDEGSAGTRIEMFELFKYLTPYDWVFGPDPASLMTWVRLHGLEYGIESFIVAFVLNFGLLCAVVFFPPLALFFLTLARAGRPGSGLAVVYFLAVSLTSISLSSKSPTLSIFVMLLVILLRPPQLEGAVSGET